MIRPAGFRCTLTLLRHRFRLVFGWVLLTVWFASGARAERFQGPVAEARWQLDASVFECRLEHSIPHFGQAAFTRRAGEPQRFVLHQSNRQLAEGEATIRIEHPSWRESAQPEPLESAPVGTQAEALTLDWQRSQRLAAALRSGQRLVISQTPWDGRAHAVDVVIEPVGFRTGMDGFNNCLVGLLPVNFDQIERNALYYPPGFSELPEAAQKTLDQIALYASEDTSITHFYIDGHTDGIGLRAENLELSRQRAESVAQYLMDRGVPERKLVVRWHGERYPVGSNREAEGRAENRRVTVRLERRDERLSRQ